RHGARRRLRQRQRVGARARLRRDPGAAGDAAHPDGGVALPPGAGLRRSACGVVRRDGGRPPAGLTLDPSTGAITGTPTAAGAFAFTVAASNSFGTRTAGYSGSVVAPNLAATGSDASPFPALALALVAAGATILLVRRRSV